MFLWCIFWQRSMCFLHWWNDRILYLCRKQMSVLTFIYLLLFSVGLMCPWRHKSFNVDRLINKYICSSGAKSKGSWELNLFMPYMNYYQYNLLITQRKTNVEIRCNKLMTLDNKLESTNYTELPYILQLEEFNQIWCRIIISKARTALQVFV